MTEHPIVAPSYGQSWRDYKTGDYMRRRSDGLHMWEERLEGECMIEGPWVYVEGTRQLLSDTALEGD